MYIHIYLFIYFQKRSMVKCLFNIYMYIHLFSLIQEMVHTTCTFHIKETTPLISCYIDNSCLLSSRKTVPNIYFFNPFFNRKSVAKENVYIFHIFEKIGPFLKTDVYIINTHVYIYTTQRLMTSGQMQLFDDYRGFEFHLID